LVVVALVRVGRGLQCLFGRDLEHGYDSLVGDLYFGDEGFNGGLALAGSAAGHDLVEVGAEPFDRAGRRWRGLVIEFIGDLCVAGAELFDWTRRLLIRGPAVASSIVPFSKAV
jgi:hypothetical protein